MIGGFDHPARGDVDRQRSRAAASEAIDRDAHLAGFVGQVVLNAGAGKDDDADRHDAKHLIVALEGRGLSMLRPVGFERNLRDLAVIGPGGRNAFRALGRSAMHQHHVRVLCVNLIELGPDRPVIGGVTTRKGDLRPRGQ